jgi:hypothetical protein
VCGFGIEFFGACWTDGMGEIGDRMFLLVSSAFVKLVTFWVEKRAKKEEEFERGTGRMVIIPRGELSEVLICNIAISSSAETGLDLSGQLADIADDQENWAGYSVLRMPGFPFESGDSLSSISINALTSGISGDIDLRLSTEEILNDYIGLLIAQEV